MPKFSTVQAYSDSNSNVQTVSYQQATGSSDGKAEKVKTEKVVNAYGSTAGANSGEFHVYRQARARELGRIETLKAAEHARQEEMEYRQKVEQNLREDEERTAKRRKKRERQKEAKRRRQNLEKAGVQFGDTTSNNESANSNPQNENNDDDKDEDEFDIPPPTTTTKNTIDEQNPPPVFANDGSFLEMMKRQMAQGSDAGNSSEKHKDNDPTDVKPEG